MKRVDFDDLEITFLINRLDEEKEALEDNLTGNSADDQPAMESIKIIQTILQKLEKAVF